MQPDMILVMLWLASSGFDLSNKAVYAKRIAPRRPKSESVTESITDRATNGPTDGHTLL